MSKANLFEVVFHNLDDIEKDIVRFLTNKVTVKKLVDWNATLIGIEIIETEDGIIRKIIEDGKFNTANITIEYYKINGDADYLSGYSGATLDDYSITHDWDHEGRAKWILNFEHNTHIPELLGEAGG